MTVCEALLDNTVAEAVESVASEIVRSIRAGGKVLLCGNGGSAADAQHLAAELVGRFQIDRDAFPAIALADNVSALTAIGNDYSYEEVFARGVRGLGLPGDVLIGLSTSGASANVIAALNAAELIGLTTVAFTGARDSAVALAATHVISIDGPSTARIQEGHMLVGHTIFESVERELCGAV